MKPATFSLFLFLATTLGSAFPNSYEPRSKGLPLEDLGLPTTSSKGLPGEPTVIPPPSKTPAPITTLTTQSKGLPPATPPPSTEAPPTGVAPPPQAKGIAPNSILAALPAEVAKGISTKCLSTLLAILTDPEILKCIPLTAVLPIAPILLDPSIFTKFLQDPAKVYPSIQKPFIQFSDGLCAAPKCDDKKVAASIKAIESGCEEDIKGKNPIVMGIYTGALIYSPLHDSICFKDKKGTYCWDETLTTFISLPKSPIKIVDGGLIDSVIVADPPKVCTPCNRAIVNTFGNYLKDKPDAQKALKGAGFDPQLAFVGVAVKCGLSFEDGNVGDPGK